LPINLLYLDSGTDRNIAIVFIVMTLPVTLSDPNHQITPFYTVNIAFHVVITDEDRNFKFGTEVDKVLS